MSSNYMLVARNIILNTVTIVEIKKDDDFIKKLPLVEIDKLTSKIFTNEQDFIRRVNYPKYEECDIYIVNPKVVNGEVKLNFIDVIYKETDYKLVKILEQLDEKNKIKKDSPSLASFVSELISKLKSDPQFREKLSERFPHLNTYFESFSYENISLTDSRYTDFIKKLTTYSTFRKLVMVTKDFYLNRENYYKDRINAEYPLYVFARGELDKYDPNLLNRKFTLRNFNINKEVYLKSENKFVEKTKEEIKEDEDPYFDELPFLSEEEIEQMTGEDNDLYRPLRRR